MEWIRGHNASYMSILFTNRKALQPKYSPILYISNKIASQGVPYYLLLYYTEELFN